MRQIQSRAPFDQGRSFFAVAHDKQPYIMKLGRNRIEGLEQVENTLCTPQDSHESNPTLNSPRTIITHQTLPIYRYFGRNVWDAGVKNRD
jgi:hypothetical protein